MPATTTLPSGVKHDEPSRHFEHFGIALGAAAITSLDRLGPAILPMIGLAWKVRPWLAVEVAVAGLGSRPTVATSVGDARLAQQYSIFGGSFWFRSNERLRPFLALSAGALHSSVEGHADSPKQGHRVDQWSLLMDGSLGAELRLPDRYCLTLAAHVQVANPYVAIHISDEVVGTTGRPNLALTLTVGAWL